MYEMTLSGLTNLMNSPFGQQYAKYLVLYIKNGSAASEVIINPKQNFEAKLEYMKTAYNEDLTLKNDPEIRIARYDMVESKLDLAELVNF